MMVIRIIAINKHITILCIINSPKMIFVGFNRCYIATICKVISVFVISNVKHDTFDLISCVCDFRYYKVAFMKLWFNFISRL